MLKKKLVIVLVAHQPYVRELSENHAAEKELIFSAINDTYLPLLKMCSRLEKDSIPFKIQLCISPTVCEQLSDSVLIERYCEWMDKLIDFAEAECSRNSSNNEKLMLSKAYLADLIEKRDAFDVEYKRDILSVFNSFSEKKHIELMATTATHACLPLYADIKEAVYAQIEEGLVSYREYFTVNPSGFWLPYMGYTNGLEDILRSYGFTYSILDSHAFLFANPIPQTGIFAPVMCPQKRFSVFARDYDTPADVLDLETGFASTGVYVDQNRDIAYEASEEDMADFLDKYKVRIPTGLSYYSREEKLYSPEEALKQTAEDAKSFLDKKAKKLSEAHELTGGELVSLVTCIDAVALGKEWTEGFSWLENVFRQAAERDDIKINNCSTVLRNVNKEKEEVIQPFPSVALGSGYGEDLLDNSNDWIIRYIRKAIERMIDLTERFPDDTGLKERSLNLAAKEVLLAMASDWPKMVYDQYFPKYAADKVTEHIKAFTVVYDSLGSNAISTEWLTRVEKEHTLFPYINYRIFSVKK